MLEGIVVGVGIVLERLFEWLQYTLLNNFWNSKTIHWLSN